MNDDWDDEWNFSEDEEPEPVIEDFPEDLQMWVNNNIGKYEFTTGFSGLIKFEQEPKIRFMVDGTVLVAIICSQRKGHLNGVEITLRSAIDVMKELLSYPIEPIVIADSSIQSQIDKILPLPISEETIYGLPAKEYILQSRRNMKQGMGLLPGHFVLDISDNKILVQDYHHPYSKLASSVLTKHFEVNGDAGIKRFESSWSNLEDRLLEFASANVLFIDGVPY